MPGKEWWEAALVLKARIQNGKDWRDVITIEQHDTENTVTRQWYRIVKAIRIAYTKTGLQSILLTSGL